MTAKKVQQSKSTFDHDAEIQRILNRASPASLALEVMGVLNGKAGEIEALQRAEAGRATVIAFQLHHEAANLTDNERRLLIEDLRAASERRDELAAEAERLRERARSYSNLADKAPQMSRRSGLRQQEMSA